jgi:hypothetical protein
MTPKEQEQFILTMYDDLFVKTDADKVPDYCAPEFIKENNYDISDYDDFVTHIKDLQTKDGTPKFNIEFIINDPQKVVIRTIVDLEDKITGAPPTSLLISYWQFNEDGLVNYCKEVELS